MRVTALFRRRGAHVGAAMAVLVLAGLAAAVPGASGGFTANILNSTDTTATAKYFKCFDAISPDLSSAYFEWPLSDQYGAISAADLSGNNRTATFVGSPGMDATTPLGCPRDGGSALKLDGSTMYAYQATSVAAPQTFSIEAYIQTSFKQGKIIGFGNASTGSSSSYDRHLYINNAGKLAFGIYNSSGAKYHVITSTAVVSDGAWHHVAATFSSSGMKLYLDGVLVNSDTTTTTAETNTGYWRVGYDNLSGWPGAPTSGFFNGRLRGIGVYNGELPAQQIATHAAPTFGS